MDLQNPVARFAMGIRIAHAFGIALGDAMLFAAGNKLGMRKLAHDVPRDAAAAQGPTQHAEMVPTEGTAAGVVSSAGPDIGQAMAPGDFKNWLRAAR